jgi:hypothetical protein
MKYSFFYRRKELFRRKEYEFDRSTEAFGKIRTDSGSELELMHHRNKNFSSRIKI